MAYGFGLVVERDPHLGTLVCHSGGYPGFGSHMRWHPASGLGVVVLGNSTYTPVPRLGSRIMDAVLAGWHPASVPIGPITMSAPATGSMGDATAAARRDVDRLIAEWDDALAGELFSMNVDLDQPIDQRRDRIEAVRRLVGPPVPDDDAPVTSTSPAHCAWWLRGPRGRVRVEIRLSPELPPRIQSLTLTAVPEPSPLHRRAATRVAAELGGIDPGWPAGLAIAPPLDRAEATRRVRAASALAGESVVADVVAADGEQEATFRLDGERTDLLVTVTTDPASTTVTGVVFAPVVP
jgi:hypothetical protein